MALTTLDIILLIIIASIGIYGLFKGFIKQALSLLAIFVGLILSSKYYVTCGQYIKESCSLDMDLHTISIISFIAIFILTLIAANIIAIIIEKFISITMLGWLNSLLGLIFGLLKGFIIASIIFIIIDFINPTTTIIKQEKLDKSMVYTIYKKNIPTVNRLIK